jgi:hypothetical protein
VPWCGFTCHWPTICTIKLEIELRLFIQKQSNFFFEATIIGSMKNEIDVLNSLIPDLHITAGHIVDA